MLKHFVLLACLALLTSACAQNKTMIYDENDAPPAGMNSEELSALQRMSEIKNGATPVVKPTGDAGSPPPLPPAPPAAVSQKAYAESLGELGYDDLRDRYRSAVISTSLGDITVELYGDESPLTANNFLNLAKKGFYDKTRFHRVINDFMIQGGDPNSKEAQFKDLWGTGDPGYKFADEFNSRPLVKGSLAMANSGPNTNGSQFFIVTKDFTPWLDGKHTNFGQVVSGMEVVEAIEASAIDERDRPLEDVVIEKVMLVER